MDEDRSEKGPRENAADFIQGIQNLRTFEQLARKGALTAGRAIIGGSAAIGGPFVVTIIAVILFTSAIALTTGGLGEASETNTSSPSQSNASIKFRCQYDPRWTIGSCNITHFGCDPTALSTIVSSFGDTTWSPLSVAQVNNMGCNGGTTLNQIENSLDWVRGLDFTVAKENLGYGRDFDLQGAKNFIDKGYLILGVANVTFRTSSLLNSGGHSFVITGVDPSSQNLTVLDPTYCTSDDNYTTRVLNLNDVLCNSQGCGWYYAKPIKK